MTLVDIQHLALVWCPLEARWERMLDKAEHWGPAHELAHALIEPRHRRTTGDYGRCPIVQCVCRADACMVHEAAAMTISGRLMRAVGYAHLANLEIERTPSYDSIEPAHFARGKALLKRKGLWPIPVSVHALEVALERRLGIPRGDRYREKPWQAYRRKPRWGFALLMSEMMGRGPL